VGAEPPRWSSSHGLQGVGQIRCNVGCAWRRDLGLRVPTASLELIGGAGNGARILRAPADERSPLVVRYRPLSGVDTPFIDPLLRQADSQWKEYSPNVTAPKEG
jgi:hypothetical protein